MKKIFIFSTSFLTRLLLMNLDYVLKINFDTVVLLRENHHESEEYSYNVELYNDIDSCLNACDCVLICRVPNIPEKNVNRLIQKATICNKKIINLEYTNSMDDSSLTEKQQINTSIPIIFHLAIGQASQFYGLEILINKVLQKHNIKFVQFFTNNTSNLLRQFFEYNILNDKLSSHLLKKENCAEVLVISKAIDMVNCSFEDTINFIHTIAPDMIIVQTDFRNDNYNELKKSIFYNTKTKVDMIVKSQYYPFKDSMIAYCKDIKTSDTELMENENLEFILEKRIFAKISYPHGVFPL